MSADDPHQPQPAPATPMTCAEGDFRTRLKIALGSGAAVQTTAGAAPRAAETTAGVLTLPGTVGDTELEQAADEAAYQPVL